MKTTFAIVAIATAFLFSSPLFAQENVATTPHEFEKEYQPLETYKDFRIAIGGGYAFRLGDTEDTGDSKLNEINKKLRHGFTIDADAQYFFRGNWGLGLNANYCSSNTSGDDVNIPGIDQRVNYKETQSFLYIGPTYAGRVESDKFSLITSVGLGPIFFNSNMNLSGLNINGSKATLGLNGGIAGEYKMSNNLGVGLKLSYVMGTIESLEIEGQNFSMDDKISVSNFMLTTFISFSSR
ncbi:MAG: outer membrane beta-barrel protein [Fermentimonas sp.]|jgi:hypothetical protein|nr:outer membrane beta-barrel protein [Dysgonamonadaceae bacterium]MDD4697711.1 outer membrane beta-barrel protein [Fermentimonas sp.]MEA5081757.1 outer membrane beta-barrel protein [Dysgonamonadaceae bacterium]